MIEKLIMTVSLTFFGTGKGNSHIFRCLAHRQEQERIRLQVVAKKDT